MIRKIGFVLVCTLAGFASVILLVTSGCVGTTSERSTVTREERPPEIRYYYGSEPPWYESDGVSPELLQVEEPEEEDVK